MTAIKEDTQLHLIDALLALADDKLMLGHRNSEWTGLGPMLEEDIAFSSLAQDHIAHAQAIYQYLSDNTNEPADQIAFGRSAEAYRCASIVEIPDEFDWAIAIARQFFCAHYHNLQWHRWSQSSCKPLAELTSRIAAEEQIQLEHVNGWMVRLGRGTEDSHDRLQHAVDLLQSQASMLFEPTTGLAELEVSGEYPTSEKDTFDVWLSRINKIVKDAGLKLNINRPPPEQHGGRRGEHTEHFPGLLDEMCEVFRIEPEAAW